MNAARVCESRTGRRLSVEGNAALENLRRNGVRNPEDCANREEEGVLYTLKTGEMLSHLRHRLKWARAM